MAKKSMIARDKKRLALIEKFSEKRATLKAEGDLDALQKLPRNSSPSRRKNRDMLDGRPRASDSAKKQAKATFLVSQRVVGKERRTKICHYNQLTRSRIS